METMKKTPMFNFPYIYLAIPNKPIPNSMKKCSILTEGYRTKESFPVLYCTIVNFRKVAYPEHVLTEEILLVLHLHLVLKGREVVGKNTEC